MYHMTNKPRPLREFRSPSEFFVVHYLTTVKVLEKNMKLNHGNVAVCVAVVYIGA